MYEENTFAEKMTVDVTNDGGRGVDEEGGNDDDVADDDSIKRQGGSSNQRDPRSFSPSSCFSPRNALGDDRQNADKSLHLDNLKSGNNTNNAQHYLAAMDLTSEKTGSKYSAKGCSTGNHKEASLPGVLKYVTSYKQYGQEGPEREREEEREKEREKDGAIRRGEDPVPYLHLHICTLQSTGTSSMSETYAFQK